MIESYQYDLYGKPRVYNASGVYQPGATPQVKDLFTGERYVTEVALYDLRNRFMSPDLGRFLQPDPIGFEGDASNLYRYCGNDWANRSDAMGMDDIDIPREWDTWGIRASMNSYNAAKAAMDSNMNSHGRSQLVQQSMKTGEISLQNKFYVAEAKPVTREAGRSEGVGEWHSWVDSEGVQPPDPGHRAIGPGHVHWDIGTNRMSATGRWSDYDVQTATTTKESVGKPVWRVDASNPSTVLRLTPQKSPGPPTTSQVGKTIPVAGLSYAGQGYFTNGFGTFTNGAWQQAIGNYGAWNANAFGAPQDDPIDSGGSVPGFIGRSTP